MLPQATPKATPKMGRAEGFRNGVTGAVPSLLWVYEGSLTHILHRATWLETSAGLAKLGWDVTLVASEVPPYELSEDVRAVCVPRPPVFLLGYLLFQLQLLLQVVRRLGAVDVILFNQDSAPFLLPITLLRKLVGRSTPKIVMDSRSVIMNTDFSTRGRIRNVIYGVIHRLANSLADGQTAITYRMAKVVGVPDQQLLGVWPSGVKPELFSSALSTRRWPRDDDPLRLVYLGALEHERNLIGLCKAVSMVRAAGEAVTLHLIGSGPQQKELEDYARESGDMAVTVSAPVPRSEVPAILASAHVGALPFPDIPEFQVSSPIKLFEYMAAGMPILATRISCHTDVLKDADWVFWAEDDSPAALAAAIQKACAAKTRLQDVTLRVASAAQDWSWEASARRLSDALLSALDEKVARVDPLCHEN